MASEQLIGRTLDGRYRIESLIARGGMATVYTASDLRLRRTVAVKVMHASLAEDPDFVHRFEREAHAAAQLANPHVVAVHDQGRDTDTGAIYLVMEFVSGRTVREVIATRGVLTPVQALAVLDPVLQALAAAHDAGYVHRDVKPENVLIGDDGRIKVTDFGLARAIVSSSLSAATQGVLIGTVAYLSPEQVERGYADARSDVYGAGVLLYEMLTGQVPHSGETPLAVAYQHVHTDVPPPSMVREGLPSLIDEVVTHATRRDPGLRYHDAREFLTAVRSTRASLDPSYTMAPMPMPTTNVIDQTEVLNGEPVKADKRTAREQAQAAERSARAEAEALAPASSRRSRRRRWPVLLFLLLVVAGIGGVVWESTIGTHSDVPQVIGMQLADAKQALTNASLKATTTDSWSKTVPEGDVIDAQPTPGMSVEHNTVVTLVVSKGPERYAVPSVLGLNVAQAKTALKVVKLRLGATSAIYDAKAAIGVILSSNPSAGHISQPGDSVDIVISKGPAPIAVPALSGQTVAAAAASLQTLGFTASTSTSYDDQVARGNVIRSTPSAGTLLQRGANIRLLVSKGPAPVRVPDVFRMTQAKATSVLRAAGLQVVVRKSSGRLLDLVKSQSPAAGTVVPRGSTVTITVV